MLDLKRLRRLSLSSRPRIQRLIAHTVLKPNYALSGVRVRFEDAGRVPDEPVIFAMNHTDRYNYWPFQLSLWQRTGRFTAAWVKGKYYEGWILSLFMALTNNIPTVSRGYLLAKDYQRTIGRRPSNEVFTQLNDLVRQPAVAEGAGELNPSESLRGAIPAAIFEQPRNILGRRFDPSRETYVACINGLFHQMMARFVELNAEAFAKGLDLIIFPQGTRSLRLLPGRIGLAQIALHLERTVVPVGCNGCDRVYPGASPWARKGEIVYRFGDPITHRDAAAWHVPAFEPFTPVAETQHRAAFEGYSAMVTERINALLDERYQLGAPNESHALGAKRFL